MSATTCPSREELFDYVVGRLSDEDSDGVAEHLEFCESCQAGLATFDDADDTLVAQLRLADDQDPYQGESQCQVAVAQARAVGGRGSLPAPEPDPASTPSLLLGTLGEYQLLEKLGRGGMGTVYKATHTKLDRVVALKVLPKSRSEDEKAIARFEREMKAIGRLDHPNIVGAYDAREIEDKPVLIMEYVEGLDLGKLVRRCGPLSVADACELARQAALGLQYAHEHGLVHRDVKPSNLMLTPQGEVKILDLGLARFHREHAAGQEMTGSGQAMGTADYMAPEQASDSHAVDIRADVYSLGCTLYKLLTGRAPFGGPDHKGTFEKMTAHVREPVPPIGEFDADVPDELAAVLDRMLAKEPDERFATPGEVAEALKPFCIDCDLGGLLVRAAEAEAAAAAEPPSPALPRGGSSGRPQSQPTPLPFWRRGKLVAAAIGLMLLSVGAGIALGIIITIYRDGKATRIGVADGSTVNIDRHGNVDVTPPGERGKPGTPAAAKSDFEAIQGTWEVVRVSTGSGGVPLVQVAYPDLTEQDLIGTKIVITSDALNVQGKNVLNFTFEYQLNSTVNPRMIDLKAGGRVLWGIYALSSDQLKICTTPAIQRRDSPPRRPTQFWAGYGSGDDLVVLRRVRDAFVTADEKAIQGTWEIVSSESKISESAKAGVSLVAHSMWPSGDAAIGRKVEITRHDFKLTVPQPTGLGGGGEEQKEEYGYAIDPTRRPKTIDFTTSRVYPGVYELNGDRLRICASIIAFPFGREDPRPKSIPAKPGEDQVVIVMRRVSRVAAAPDAEAIQGTWQLVDATLGLDVMPFLYPVDPKVTVAKLLKDTKWVITKDAVKIQGASVVDVTWQYKLNPSANPKFIDMMIDYRSVVLGVYELDGDRLKICIDRRAGGSEQRPKEIWAEYGSTKEVFVLQRIGEGVVTADEKAIQGTWEVVRCETQVSKTTMAFAPVCFRWPSGETPKGRQVEITRHNLTLKPPPGQPSGAGPQAVFCAYGLDPTKQPRRIDFLDSTGYAFAGVYELDADELSICASLSPFVSPNYSLSPDYFEIRRPKSIPAKPAKDQMVIVMRRVHQAAAEPGAEAIQGTWQVVSSSFRLFPMVGRAEGVTKDEVIRTTKVVITQDAFKFLGKHIVDVAYQYQLDPGSSPKIIDLKAGSRIALGVYELAGDQLKVCALPVFRHPVPTQKPQRPNAVWAEYGSGKELLVLKRVGDAVVTADEQAIQGDWEVIRSEGQLPHQDLTYSFGDELQHRKVRITRHDLAIKRLAYEKSESYGPSDPLKGTTSWEPAYALDPSQQTKTIDLVYYGSEWLGIYELKGGQLTIYFGKTRPSGFEAKPGEDQVLIEMQRVRDVSGMPNAEAIQGTWKGSVQTTEKSPEGDEKSQSYPVKLVVTESGFSYYNADNQLGGAFEYTIDSTLFFETSAKTPKVIDLWLDGVLVCMGIYQLDGDRLRVMLPLKKEGQPRPKSFFLPAYNKCYLFDVRRDGGPDSAATPAGRDVLAVRVDPHGQVSVRGKPHDPASLQKLLWQLIGDDPQTTVRLSAEPQTQHRHVVAVLDLVKAAGVTDVSIAVAEPPDAAEAATAPRGILDLRIAPSRIGDGWAVLDEATIEHYIKALQAKGPERAPKFCEQAIEQKELSRIVSAIEGIESATVRYHTLLGPDAHRITHQPSASVGVKTLESKPLNDKQVMQIQKVVATALAGVERDQVPVTDLNTGDRFEVDRRTGKLRSERYSLWPAPPFSGPGWEHGGSRSLAYVPGVNFTRHIGANQTGRTTVTVAVPRSYFELVWHRQNPVADGQEPRTPPQEELDEIQQDLIHRIRRHIAAQLPEIEGVADPSELFSLTVFDDNWSWATLEQMAKTRARALLTSRQYGWFELATEPLPDLITATYEARQYVLLSRQRAETMLAYDGSVPRDWELKAVRGSKDQQGRPVIDLEFNEVGEHRLGALSDVFRGNRLAILVDDKVIATPMLESKLTDKLQFRGDFDEEEAQRLVRLLQAGRIEAGDSTSAQPAKADESAGEPLKGEPDDQPQTDGAD